ncbi:hypothetical protein AB0L65_32755 [Nonomuraea sp. NPDC052116]|uniref:hypothetical protein n=1 Tax=Nonomuraea sp. NPDC052116 TaxID=3155665 RepID=UPI00342C8E0E
MTGRWFTYNQARERLGITWADFKALVASGALQRELIGDHYSISEASVLDVLAAHGGDDQTAGPAFTPWTRAEDPDAFNDRATPKDEGDEH